MRNRPMLRPQFETMESLTLLSASPVSALGSVTAQIAAQPQAKTVAVTLKGQSMVGKFVRSATANTVAFMIKSGKLNQVTPLQKATISGAIVYNRNGLTPTSLKKATITIKVDPRDLIVVTLAVPQGSSPTSQTFNYQITKATGKFKGNQESGQVTFALNPFALQGPYQASWS